MLCCMHTLSPIRVLTSLLQSPLGAPLLLHRCVQRPLQTQRALAWKLGHFPNHDMREQLGWHAMSSHVMPMSYTYIYTFVCQTQNELTACSSPATAAAAFAFVFARYVATSTCTCTRQTTTTGNVPFHLQVAYCHTFHNSMMSTAP